MSKYCLVDDCDNCVHKSYCKSKMLKEKVEEDSFMYKPTEIAKLRDDLNNVICLTVLSFLTSILSIALCIVGLCT